MDVFRRAFWGGSLALACGFGGVCGDVSAATGASAKADLVARAEQMAMQMLPEKELDRAAGFFGPVSKKYRPVCAAFQREYAAAKEKLPVVRKYLPEAEAAYAEAQAMKVPAKYEAEKQKYLKMFQAFLTVVRLSLAVSA